MAATRARDQRLGLGVLEGSGDIVYKSVQVPIAKRAVTGCSRFSSTRGDSHWLCWAWTSFGFLVLSVRSAVAAGGT